MQTPPPPPPPFGAYPGQPPGQPAQRPGVVTAAAVLFFVAGGLSVLGGLLALVGGALFASVSGAFGAILVFVAIVVLAVGALDLYCGGQVLNLRRRGYTLGIVLAIISGVLALIQIGRSPGYEILQIAVDAFIIWALYSNKDLFTA